MEKIRLLAVIDYLGGGGAERQFMELVKRIDRGKFDTVVLVTEGGGVRLDEAIGEGIRVLYPRRERNRNTIRALRDARRAIKETSPDVVMAWLSYSATIVSLAARLTGGDKKLIFSERSSLERLFDKEVRFGAVKKAILKRAFGTGTFVVTNSRNVAEEFVAQGYADRERVRVIYNGLDLDGLSSLPSKTELRSRLGLSGDKKYGVFVGTLEYRKGVTFLKEAAAGMAPGGPEIIVLGKGSLEKELSGASGITCLGYRAGAAEYIKASDFLVLPSLYEGMPNVVLEAMAVGTPVIATDVSGIPEIITHGETGLLIRPEDAGSIAGAVTELMGDDRLAAGIAERARQKVGGFSMGAMVEAYEKLIVEAAAR